MYKFVLFILFFCFNLTGSNRETIKEFKLPEQYQVKYNELSKIYENYKGEHVDGGILKELPLNFNIISQIINSYNAQNPENKTDLTYKELVDYFKNNTNFEKYTDLIKQLIQLLKSSKFNVSESDEKLLLKNQKDLRGFDKNIVASVIQTIFLHDNKQDFLIFLTNQLESIIKKRNIYEKFLNNNFMVIYTDLGVKLRHISFIADDDVFYKNHFEEKIKISSEDIQPSYTYFINMNDKQEIENNVEVFLNLVNRKGNFKYEEFDKEFNIRAIDSVFNNLLPRDSQTTVLINLIDEYSKIPKTDYLLKNKRIKKLIEISKEAEKLNSGKLSVYWLLDAIRKIAVNKAKYLIAIDKIKELAFSRITKMPEKGSEVTVQNFQLETPQLLLTKDYTAEWLRDVDPAGRSVKFHQKYFSTWKRLYDDTVKKGTDADFPSYFWWLEGQAESEGRLPELDFMQSIGVEGTKLNIENGLIYSDKMLANYNNYLYVLSEKGALIVSKKEDFHHDRLLKGANVVCAGHINIKDGKIIYIDNISGHYQPKVYPHLMTALNILDSFKVLNLEIEIKDDGNLFGKQGITYEDFKTLETIKMRPLCKPVTMPLIEIFLQKENLSSEISLSNDQLNVIKKINIKEICTLYFGEFKVGKIGSIEEAQKEAFNSKKNLINNKINKLTLSEKYKKKEPINEKQKKEYQQIKEEAAKKIQRSYRKFQTEKLEQNIEN